MIILPFLLLLIPLSDAYESTIQLNQKKPVHYVVNYLMEKMEKATETSNDTLLMECYDMDAYYDQCHGKRHFTMVHTIYRTLKAKLRLTSVKEDLKNEQIIVGYDVVLPSKKMWAGLKKKVYINPRTLKIVKGEATNCWEQDVKKTPQMVFNEVEKAIKGKKIDETMKLFSKNGQFTKCGQKYTYQQVEQYFSTLFEYRDSLKLIGSIEQLLGYYTYEFTLQTMRRNWVYERLNGTMFVSPKTLKIEKMYFNCDDKQNLTMVRIIDTIADNINLGFSHQNIDYLMSIFSEKMELKECGKTYNYKEFKEVNIALFKMYGSTLRMNISNYRLFDNLVISYDVYSTTKPSLSVGNGLMVVGQEMKVLGIVTLSCQSTPKIDETDRYLVKQTIGEINKAFQNGNNRMIRSMIEGMTLEYCDKKGDEEFFFDVMTKGGYFSDDKGKLNGTTIEVLGLGKDRNNDIEVNGKIVRKTENRMEVPVKLLIERRTVTVTRMRISCHIQFHETRKYK